MSRTLGQSQGLSLGQGRILNLGSWYGHKTSVSSVGSRLMSRVEARVLGFE